MKNEHNLIITLKAAVRIAVTFFTIGSVLFVLQFFTHDVIGLAILGLIFIVIAVIFNGITAILIIIDLIKRDRLESFTALCILLANIPIAAGYAYLLMEFNL